MRFLGFLLLVVSAYAMAEEVYYCTDNHNGANGFANEDGEYKRTGFIESKFKMKFQDDGDIVIAEETGNTLYFCATPYGRVIPETKNLKSCVSNYHNGYYFNFNPDNGRYVYIQGAGYVFGGGDTVSTHIGTCTKF